MGYRHLSDIEDTTLYEYEMKMKAFNLSQVDQQNEMHMQAWLNHQVTASKEQGKKTVPVFKKYEDFFNYEKELKRVEKQTHATISPKLKRMAKIAASINRERG